jgi:hypothetical protein
MEGWGSGELERTLVGVSCLYQQLGGVEVGLAMWIQEACDNLPDLNG